MDGQNEPEKPVIEVEDKAAEPKQPQQPIMDVRRPKPTDDAAAIVDEPKTEESAEATKPAASPERTEGLSSDHPEVTDDPARKLEEPHDDKKRQPPAPKPPKPPRQPGVGLAIVATMVIVLALAALATYAYLRTNNVALF